MSELKPGDKVWIPATASIVFPSGDVWFSDRRGFHIEWAESSIPDVPNLAAVARVLAAHPGIGLSCDKIITYVSGVLDLMDSVKPDDKPINDKMRIDVRVLRALAAALNGGTE